MYLTFALCTGLIVVFAALRSTWSPCGLSMLSTITPMAERSRGRRWGFTAAWFVLGASMGGATLGLGAAVLAWCVSLLHLSIAATLTVAGVAALIAGAMDCGVGTEMPHHRRQVDEAWLDQFRSWVYGIGFGWQIGTGLMTYIMTAGVYLTVVLAALTGRPGIALVVCTLFGLTRGLMILLGVRLTTPERLRVFHRRFEHAGPSVRWAVIVVQFAVAAATLGAAFGVTGVGASALGSALVVAIGRRRDPSPLTPGVQPAAVAAAVR